VRRASANRGRRRRNAIAGCERRELREGRRKAAADLYLLRLLQRCRSERVERFVGTADLQNFFRRSHGPGWALVGDAGYHKDPVTAQGISDSFSYAELLVEAIDDGLAGRRPLSDALARYEQKRSESATPIFEWTCRTGEMRPISQKMATLLEALRTSQEDTNRFLGLSAGTVLSTDFFRPENLARIVAAATG
jgi:flavin-dependent dehydrogenase